MAGLIITVNYKTADTTIQFIQNLRKLNDFSSAELYIADNGSDISIIEKLNTFLKGINLPNIHLVPISENKGYFGAINYLLKYHIEIERYNYIIVCNNDIIINDEDFLLKTASFIEKNDLIAPRIITLVDKCDQNPHRENPLSHFQKIQYSMLYSNYYFGFVLYFLRNILYRKFISLFKTKSIKLESRNIFAMHGSYMIFSKAYFTKGGYIDDGFFLYGEEDSVAAISQLIKCKIKFIPELIVFHDEHKTTLAHGFKKRIYKLQKEAYLYIKKKYKKVIY